MPSFSSLGLIEPLLRALSDEGYTSPTPIQAQAIPYLLQGRDVLGCAQTGTGKTAAFALPVLQLTNVGGRPKGKRHISTLILTPTRELAAQIEESFSTYGRHVDVDQLVIFGGVNENPQIKALRRGQEVLVATPGRLLDLLGRGFVDLSRVEFFVLDEADRMLDMGFVHDVRRVLAELPEQRQNLLFSATMPDAIVRLAGSFLQDPVKIEVTPESKTVERIEQQVCFVSKGDKVRLLSRLLRQEDVTRAIVFTRTKHGANRLCQKLVRERLKAEAIHGNKSQGARQRALDGFRTGAIPVLIATDLASRGIDVDEVSHVFNYDLPNEPESYVHRIGRTGRAGRCGIAISFCDESEGAYLRAIEKLIQQEVPIEREHPFHLESAIPPLKMPGRVRTRGGRGGGPPRGGGGRSGSGGRPRPSGRPGGGSSQRRRRRPGSPSGGPRGTGA